MWRTAVAPDSNQALARATLRQEILRWNPTLNLVTRQDTEAQLERLLDQCEAGFGLLAGRLSALGMIGPRIGYADVGSGNGLPGILWIAALHALGASGPCWLVEPRGRRAWFLSRVVRMLAWRAGVLAGRWGDPLTAASPPGDMIISLKALRLTEPDVLGGLVKAFGSSADAAVLPQRVGVVRFLGPVEEARADLEQELLLNAVPAPWLLLSHDLLEGPQARLLLTVYSSA